VNDAKPDRTLEEVVPLQSDLFAAQFDPFKQQCGFFVWLQGASLAERLRSTVSIGATVTIQTEFTLYPLLVLNHEFVGPKHGFQH
jgi:hypothetical protein